MISKVVSEFESRFGYKPLGVWSAPGRANLIGEHTDYNLGFVLPFGIDRRTYVALSPRTDKKIRVGSSFSGAIVEFALSDSAPENLDWAGYPIGVAWVMREYAKTGFDAWYESDVPVGAGLSSSAAIECATASALNEIWDAGLEPHELAKIGQKAENQVVGAPTGIMDQMASMKAKRDSAVLIDCRTLETEQIPLGLEARDLIVAVIDTTVAHRHSDGGYRSRRASCELGAQQMSVLALRDLTVAELPKAQAVMDDVTFRRVRHIVTENQRVLDAVEALKSGNLKLLGELLLASHASMRDDFEISIPELDLAVEVAMQEGAIGSRMTGGGFGGAAIAIIEASKLEKLASGCEKAFKAMGYDLPKVFAVQPSDGAHREI